MEYAYTPKEKAKELIDKYYTQLPDFAGYHDLETARQCALIAVDLLMKEAYRQNDYEGFMAHWKEVKQEIEKQ